MQHQIWTANGDGSDPRLLATTTNLDAEPRISHDGQFVAWAVNMSPLDEMWIMVQSTAGGEAVRLPNVDYGGYTVWGTVSNTLAYRSRMPDGDDVFAVEVAADPSALIPIGTDVRAAMGPISVRFPSVSVAGALTVTPSTPRHADPANFRLLPNSYYDIHPSATFAGLATVTLSVPGDYDGDLAKLKVFHWKDSGWETLSPTVNAVARTLTFQTDSFSDFAVAEPLTAPTEVSTPASSNWSLAAFALLLSAMFAIVSRRRLGTRE